MSIKKVKKDPLWIQVCKEDKLKKYSKLHVSLSHRWKEAQRQTGREFRSLRACITYAAVKTRIIYRRRRGMVAANIGSVTHEWGAAIEMQVKAARGRKHITSHRPFSPPTDILFHLFPAECMASLVTQRMRKLTWRKCSDCIYVWFGSSRERWESEWLKGREGTGQRDQET